MLFVPLILVSRAKYINLIQHIFQSNVMSFKFHIVLIYLSTYQNELPLIASSVHTPFAYIVYQ